MGVEPPPTRDIQYRYRFGTAEFDEVRVELRVDGECVEIQRRPLEVLAVLLRHAGEVVTREELREAVWDKRITVDNVIDTALTKLRHVLGERNAELIQTQPRVGFRLLGPVEKVAVGRRFPGELVLSEGQAIAHREHFQLVRLLGCSPHDQVWLARHVKTQERRVYKLSAGGEGLDALKREVTLARVLRESLGEREDLVRILDWNFKEPPFFLESEYAGENFVDWAAAHLGSTPLSERLALLAQVADTVAAAHGVGVLHKDLKPANLLISSGPGGTRVRVTDFGSGRLLEPDRLAALGITQFGATLTQGVTADSDAATPLYVAPERYKGETATTRSDVFALGVMLYQLVVGDLRKPLAPGWERDVSDEILRRDIAAATDGDPAARLGSAAELADRLRRVDERRSELARQRALQRQLNADHEALRHARARRPWVIATIVTLCAGMIGMLGLFASVTSARRSLARQYAVAHVLNTFLTDDFIAVANPDQAGRADVTVVEATRAAASKIDTVFRQVGPDVRGRLHAAMQWSFFGLDDFPAALAQGREALTAYRAASALDPQRIAEARILQALTLAKLSRLDEASAQLARAAAAMKAMPRVSPTVNAQYWWARASVESYRLALPQALADYQHAWILAKAASGLPLQVRDQIGFSYADTLRLSGHFGTAERQASALLASERAQLGSDSPETCYTAALLASILGFRGETNRAIPMVTQAVACLTQSLGPTNARTIAAYQVMGNLQFQGRRYADAAVTYAKVANLFAGVVGPQALKTISARENTGVARQYAGQFDAAQDSLQKALALARTALGWTHPTTEDLRYHLADCLLDLRRTVGVDALMDGLSVRVLNEGEIESDWIARLAYQRGRLAFYAGHMQVAVQLLQGVAKQIAAQDPNGPISVSAIQSLIRTAQAVEAAKRTTPE
ncbi:MAG: winged helix-turn-helix domain-containing protein [Gammaproteobacteria bacterium]|nr:winged helix-turn-helix domain-containing protein [Gammaproteobacteria bacterium]